MKITKAHSRLVVFAVLFALFGVVGVIIARADTSSNAEVEAESGQVQGNAHVVTSQGRSGNQTIMFGNTTPTPTPITQEVCGTWALQQADNYTDFYNRFRFTTANAMAYTNIRGFSFRLPWNAGTSNADLVSQFEQADSLINHYQRGTSRQTGKDFALRFMAGRWTPQYVFDNGAYYYTLADGTKIPKPFSDTGQPGNPAFEAAYRQTVSALATWARANSVHILHLPWYGKEWAELSNTSDLQHAPGYSYSAWLQGHERLIDIALEYAGPQSDGTNLTIEFPMSGAGRLADGQMPAIDDLTNYIISKEGANSEKIFIQANGWGPVSWGYGDWGALSASLEDAKDIAGWGTTANPKQILRGEQAIQGDNNYNWDTMYRILNNNHATYAEVYVSSFQANPAPNTTAQLATKISEFKSQACAAN